MATLYQSPCFFTLSSRKIILNQEEYKINWNTSNQHYPPQKHSRICVCEAKKSRGRRKVKSNVELCNDIREFVSAAGLPEGHVPSMKELSNHGRNDLAHLVRRRGYKLIRDLLSNSIEAETDGSNLEKNLTEGQSTNSDGVDVRAEGQDEKVEDIIEDIQDSSLSTQVPITQDFSGSAGINPESSAGEHSSMLFTSLTASNSVGRQDKEVEDVVEVGSSSIPHGSDNVKQQDSEVLSRVGDNVSNEVLIVDNSHSSLNGYHGLNSDTDTCMPVKSSVNSFLEEKALKNSKVLDEKDNHMAENISLPAGVSNLEYPANDVNIVAGLNFADHSCIPANLAANSSLEDKVAKFIQNGDLDAIEDNVYGMFDGSAEEHEGVNQSEDETEFRSKIPSEENFEHAVSRSNAVLALNGSISVPKHTLPPERLNHPVRNDGLPVEDLAGSNQKDLDVETRRRENQVEIDNLKFMLNQKELELSRLKEQIEKEKLSLSDLQTKAEAEISKAQKLISEKDAELLAAEENLSGLVEVKIQYCGDGQIVEVAGSFNGWHERIKMDPQPSSSVADTGSRNSKLWSTMLWLYPGKYEIKFIVDGHWTLDPQRESVSWGGIPNNILRVG